MRLTKEDAFNQIRQAFKDYDIEFINPDSIVIRVRVFFDEHHIVCVSLPQIPKIGYITQSRLDVSISVMKNIFTEEYADYLRN